MPYYQGDYYMAGGFFKKLGGAFKKVGRFAGGIARVASPLVTAVNPALGVGINAVSQLTGRTSQQFTPTAAPAGYPTEGTPPIGPVYQAATYGGMDPQFMQLLMLLLLRRR